jgi:hypothetical protein
VEENYFFLSDFAKKCKKAIFVAKNTV